MNLNHQYIHYFFTIYLSLILWACYDDHAWSVTIYEPICKSNQIRCNGNQEQICNQLGQWEPPRSCLDGSNCVVINGVEGCYFNQDDQNIPKLSEADLMLADRSIQIIQDRSISMIDQTIDQAINQTIDQAINQTIDQAINQTIDQSIIDQSIIDQSIIDQSIDLSVPITYPCDPNCPNIDMIAIQPGQYQMGGSPQNTSPIHAVQITQGFWISKAES
jgi:hypothetical protein